MTSSKKFQDENDSYWDSKEKRRGMFDDGESDDDVVGWDGKPAKTPQQNKVKSARSARFSARKPATTSLDSKFAAEKKIIPNLVASSATPKKPSPLMNRRAATPRTTNSYDPISKTGSYEPSGLLSDKMKSSIDTTAAAVSLEAENSRLRRLLKEHEKAAEKGPSVEVTLHQFMTGKLPRVLELYKSKQEKLEMLDKSIERLDGNAILAATLFLRNTLRRELFTKELMHRPVAVDHYCSYLQQSGDVEELHKTLTGLGRNEEAAVVKYKHILQTKLSANLKSSQLNDCVFTYFETDPSLNNEAKWIKEQKAMLDRQVKIDSLDDAAEKEGSNLNMKTFPRSGKQVYKPISQTLLHGCLYHFNTSRENPANPVAIRDGHNLSKKQFEYVVTEAFGRLRSYGELERFFKVSKTFYRSAHMSSTIGFEKVVEILYSCGAPNDVLGKYCQLIGDAETRLNCAVKFRCHKQVIDAHVHMRNRTGLQVYIKKLPADEHVLHEYALRQYNSNDVKWRS